MKLFSTLPYFDSLDCAFQDYLYLGHTQCKRKKKNGPLFAPSEPKSPHHYQASHSAKTIQVLWYNRWSEASPLYAKKKKKGIRVTIPGSVGNKLSLAILRYQEILKQMILYSVSGKYTIFRWIWSLFRYLLACLHCKESSVCICYSKATFSLWSGLVISGIPFPLCHMVHRYCSFQCLL